MKIKRFFPLLTVLVGALTLSGCSIIFDIIDDIDDDNQRTDIDFNVDKIDVDGKTIIQKTYTDIAKNSPYLVDYCPTSGEVKLLIIPVWFNDSNRFITSNTFKDNVREDIKTAYLGTTEETGWHSVKTYYEEESSGALTIDGTVSDWYEVNYSYITVGENGSITDELVRNATDWYFTNNPSDNRSNYDSDNNGFIDGIMLIYAAPNYASLNNKNYKNLWAYCYWLQDERETSEAIPNTYFWASYDFMYSKRDAISITGSSYGYGNTTYCNIDAHTYIHEMGHVFGLDDYYDYSDNEYNPAGGFSMQDYNVGGHDPYSVMALGWANPYVVTGNSKVTIGTFQKTRDLIVVSSSWNGGGSPFDEYLIFELYSPTGLNQFDVRHNYSGIQGPNKVGIRLWHVDGRLAYSTDVKRVDNYYEPVFSPTQLTSNPNDSRNIYGVTHAFSNTYNDKDYGSVLGKNYYDYNLLQLIRNDKTATFRPAEDLMSTDLFSEGSYALTDFSSQFVKGGNNKMNNDDSLDWKFKININGSGEDAIAEIEIIL